MTEEDRDIEDQMKKSKQAKNHGVAQIKPQIPAPPLKTMNTFDELTHIDENIHRKIIEDGEKDVLLQKKMLEKLGVIDIPSMQFAEADRVITFSELYEFRKIMGYGGFGFVVAAKDKESKKNVALKIVCKDDEEPTSTTHQKILVREAEILKDLDHENIIKIYKLDIYENYVVMSLKLTKESIYDFLERTRKKKEPLTEDQCAQIMKGIFNGLMYLHDEKNIIHRDLKPGNVLIGSYKDLSKCKIIDFGLAVHNKKENIRDYDRCGTLLYQPPEQAINNFAYGKMADIWAAGIIMYELITGQHPFYKSGINRENIIEILRDIKEFNYPKSISPQAVHLIQRLCTKESAQRFKAKDALKHPWITRQLNDQLPLTDYEWQQTEMKKFEIELKLRLVFNLSVVMSITQLNNTKDKKVLCPRAYSLKLRAVSGNPLKLTKSGSRAESALSIKRNYPQIEIIQTPSLIKKMQQQQYESKETLKDRSYRLTSINKIQEEDEEQELDEAKSLQNIMQGTYYEDLSPDMKDMFRKLHIKIKRKELDNGVHQQQKNRKKSKVKDSGKLIVPVKRRGSINSSTSPKELKMSNANFSDLGSSDESLLNDSFSNSPALQKKKNKGLNNKKTIGQTEKQNQNNKLPGIDNKTSLQLKNQIVQPKEILMKIKEQRAKELTQKLTQELKYQNTLTPNQPLSKKKLSMEPTTYSPILEGSFIQKQMEHIKENEEYVKSLGKHKKGINNTQTNWNQNQKIQGSPNQPPSRKISQQDYSSQFGIKSSIQNFEFAADLSQKEQRQIFGAPINYYKK